MEQTILRFLLCAAKRFPKQPVSLAGPGMRSGQVERCPGPPGPGALLAQGSRRWRRRGPRSSLGRLLAERGRHTANLAWLVFHAVRKRGPWGWRGHTWKQMSQRAGPVHQGPRGSIRTTDCSATGRPATSHNLQGACGLYRGPPGGTHSDKCAQTGDGRMGQLLCQHQ